jgi:hypothetical protein
MSSTSEQLEKIWGNLLSRERDLVLSTFRRLDPSSRKVVMDHLKEMSTGEGWHPEQKISADYALEILHKKKSHKS